MFDGPYFLRHSPDMNGDPLSDILTFLDAKCLVTGGFSAGGRWGVHFQSPKAIKFSAITKGECWLVTDGFAEPQRLLTGDIIFFKGDRSFSMLSGLDVEPGDAEALIGRSGGMSVIGTGADFINLGGHVALDERRSGLLLDELPPFIRISGATREAAGLQWLLKELIDEGALDSPGSNLSTSHLAHLMYVRVLRAHLANSDIDTVGWLRGLGDARIAPALRLLHADPQHNWNLKELAKAAGMSRSVFAARFKAVVGVPPLNYLTTWRMRLATQALQKGNQPLSLIAESLGYTSESAFSNAFKRAFGSAPKRFQSAAKSAAKSAAA